LLCGLFDIAWDLTVVRVDAKVDPLLEGQFAAGRLYAVVSSRPGQSGRADGYILEGKELEVEIIADVPLESSLTLSLFTPQFYLRKLRTGKQKHAHGHT
jgi:small subunit ribosomal protein S8e